MTGAGMPPAEVSVDPALVRRLLERQRPDLAGSEVVPLAVGWDNFSYRVGDQLVARLPRREVAVPLLRNEVRWLPELAPRLPLPVPTPVFVGEPGEGYPWPWTLTNLVPGRVLGVETPPDQVTFATRLAGFLSALHQPAPPEAPHNPFRGVPLARRDHAVRDRLRVVSGMVEVSALVAVWDSALAAAAHPGPARWLHGDLHPHNLTVSSDGLCGVLDFGDLTAGDPATDLAVAWMVFDVEGRAALAGRYAADDDTWVRAKGWAAAFALVFLAAGDDHSVLGQKIAAALAAPA